MIGHTAVLSSGSWSSESFRTAFNATKAQMQDLESFYGLLAEWNQCMNLVGPTALTEFWLRHVADSAQLLHVEQSALRWADVGAGAGFPGVVLAILLKDRAGAKVHLIESMSKRANFLRYAAESLGLPVLVHHARAERLEPSLDIEVVTARACAPLPRLFSYTVSLFRSGATGLFLKGRNVEQELTAARTSWTFSSDLIESRSDPAGRIVRIRSLKPRG